MTHESTPSVVASPSRVSAQDRTYLRVFVALLVLTLVEYLYARWFADSGFWILIGGLLSLAVVKAALVGLYFMHLIHEGRWKYLLLVPSCVFAMVLIAGLYPDISLHAYQSTFSGGSAPAQDSAKSDV